MSSHGVTRVKTLFLFPQNHPDPAALSIRPYYKMETKREAIDDGASIIYGKRPVQWQLIAVMSWFIRAALDN